MHRIIFSCLLILAFNQNSFAQGCCSGGSGSPIAGGTSQGVLAENQLELAVSYQYLSSNKFKTLGEDSEPLFASLTSNYLYGRAAIGLSKKLTLSIETGYFINKTQNSLKNVDVKQSSGIGDLIIFPRFQVYQNTCARNTTEIVVGLGYKMPLGKYNDSTLAFKNPNTGQEYYTILPPTVQPSAGSHDLILYAFYLKEFRKSGISSFANLIHINKGWNELGLKFGSYSSVGLFVGKTFFNKLGTMLQLKSEYIGSMKSHKKVDVTAEYNIDPTSTGSRKLSVVPQLNFPYKNFTFFGFTDIPLYQYANGTQVVAQKQFVLGFSYRTMLKNEHTIELE